MTSPNSTKDSPAWGANIKLVVGLTVVAILAALLIRFRSILPPLILTFILTYLLHPVIRQLSNGTKLSWRMSVNIVFIILIILLITIFTLVGLALVQQLQSLVKVVERFVNTLPEVVENLSTQVYQLGPFELNMSQYFAGDNLEILIQQLISNVRPLLGQAGGLLGTVAAGTATTFMWGFLIILLAYFILSDMGKVSQQFMDVDLPGYGTDIRRLGKELGRIWNAFLRGQFILFTLTFITYLILLTVLGVRNVLGIALLAGLARFVPYVGQWVSWTVLVLVTAFQRSNHFGLETFQFVLLVFIIALIVDQVMDSFVAPRILGQTLGVHPAAVLVAAIIAANLLGLLGVVLAAPVLATLTLLGKYIVRKMLDMDPWPEPEEEVKPIHYPWIDWRDRFLKWAHGLRKRIARDE